jgi:hypothetical protein
LYPGLQGSSTPGDGTIQKGYRGDSYVVGSADTLQPPGGGGNEFVTGGPNGSSRDALSVPTKFIPTSTDQG